MPELERKKTGGLTALGALCLVLGGVALITVVWAFLQPEVIRHQAERYGAPDLLAGFGMIAAYVDASVNLILAGTLFVAGIGLLMLKRWGRTLALWYAWPRIAWSFVSAIFALVGPYSAQPDAEALRGIRPEYREAMQHSFSANALTLIVGGLILSTLFAVILICLLSRQSYKDNLS